jgi:transposase
MKFRKTGEIASKEETQPATDEIKRLRKELERVKMERDILKKATAYFAKESL